MHKDNHDRTKSYTLSLHDALPILLHRLPRDRPGVLQEHLLLEDAAHRLRRRSREHVHPAIVAAVGERRLRSEEHTSELQSHVNLVCRLLLEKTKKKECDSEEFRYL